MNSQDTEPRAIKWLDTARRVVRTHQHTMADPETGADLGEAPEWVYEHRECCEDVKQGETCATCQLHRPVPKGRKRRGVILDSFTASMLVQVYDALNEKNRAMFASFPLTKAVAVGWKAVRR